MNLSQRHWHMGNARGLLVVISGPAGSGKTSMVEEITRRSTGHICRVITATTRPPRAGEIDGRDYYFLTKENFEEKLQRGEFVEYNVFNDNYYGTPQDRLQAELAQNKVVVLVIDVNGAEKVWRQYPASVRIFVLPPTREILRARLQGRGTESAENVERRLAIAENEIGWLENYDYLVVNDDLQLAVSDTLDIINNSYSHHIRGGELTAWLNNRYQDWHGQVKTF
ncbi:guanylate kinase [Planctomycetales bacterium]|nr:guanylate kinase [Planctomycetales bacterium]GHT00678.1 guanylate kinase [Planctomycetales bacterium]GHT07974.1 guanylate kinase [Planctomycetales bacterium]GHV22134.1 guanylate kinase [Planctomycetales bacterium]